MSNSSANIYLVAGATRGIGLALVAEIAEKDPSAVIYAGGRNPSGSSLWKPGAPCSYKHIRHPWQALPPDSRKKLVNKD
ncbi:hypothetical protein BDN70DRAFT_883245, partial [Pholiota conissans]